MTFPTILDACERGKRKKKKTNECESAFPTMRVAVIGAGPSGLTTLKHLTQARKHLDCQEVEARLFEYQPHVGGTFVARVYEDAEVKKEALLPPHPSHVWPRT